MREEETRMERAMELVALGPASPEARAWAARAAPDDGARQALYGSETLDDALHALARMLAGERPAPDEAALALAVARAELPAWAVDKARKHIEALGGEWGAERKGRDGGAWRLENEFVLIGPHAHAHVHGPRLYVRRTSPAGETFAPAMALHEAWLRARYADREVKHPFLPLISGWWRRPPVLAKDVRGDKRIVPTMRSKAPEPQGMLIPRWAVAPEYKRVPLLDMADSAGLPVVARGKGAALDARLFVYVLSRPLMEGRPVNGEEARVEVSVRELRDALFPHGRWVRKRDWPRLQAALRSAGGCRIFDGRCEWTPVWVPCLPGSPSLDDTFSVHVAYPPGAASGPSVPLHALRRLSVENGPRWRAALGAHTIAWIPGKTRVPAPKVRAKGGPKQVWTSRREAYPVLTLADRRRIAFGAGDAKHRTKAEINDAFTGLPDLTCLSKREVRERTEETGWLVLPDEAAEAVRRGERKRVAEALREGERKTDEPAARP